MGGSSPTLGSGDEAGATSPPPISDAGLTAPTRTESQGGSADGPTPHGPSKLSGLVAGPIAGVFSRLVTHPGDTIKARLQVQGSLAGTGQAMYTGVWDAAKKVVQKEGMRGFYRGFGAVAVGVIPANMAYFGGYELGKAVVPGGWGLAGDMLVGATAQLTGGVLFTPVDIIKERMQVQGIMAAGSLRFTGSWHALKYLVQQRGPLGLFRGYWATNAVWIPWSMIHISFYEQSKRVCHTWWQSTHESASPPSSNELPGVNGSQQAVVLPAWVLGVCSATSATLACVLTNPMDVIKTRLQVLSTGVGDAQPGRVTARGVAIAALRKEGPRVFMAGALARILTLAPGSALVWMVYEPVKAAVDALLLPTSR